MAELVEVRLARCLRPRPTHRVRVVCIAFGTTISSPRSTWGAFALRMVMLARRMMPVFALGTPA